MTRSSLTGLTLAVPVVASTLRPVSATSKRLPPTSSAYVTRLRRVGLRHDRAVAHREIGDGYVQMLRAELEQHAARFRGNAAHRPTIALDTVGAARAALVGPLVGGAHDETRLVVGHVELVAHHLPERRARALAAVRLADEERRRVVRMDDDPRVELKEIGVGIRARADGLRERAPAGHAADRDADDQRARRREEAAARDRRIGRAQRVFDRARELQCRAHAALPSVPGPRTTRLIACWMR